MNSTKQPTENQNTEQQTREDLAELDLSRFVDAFFKFWWLCVILAVICAGVTFVYSYTRFVPRYQASVTFTVQTSQIGTNNMGITSYSFSYNRATASQLSASFPSIIKSNILQDVICRDLELSYFPCTLTASSVSGTNMFTITAAGLDPQLTYEVLQSVIRNYPMVSQYVLGNTRMDILTEPVVPTKPYNELAYRTQALKGALVGFCMGLLWVVYYTMMRKTICERSDIRTKLNQNCLGVLPEVVFKKYNKEIDRSITLTNPKIGEGYLESFRALRNSIIGSEDDPKVIMVTSTAPGEGKTSVAVNLALSLAMMNKKVIIVDADIRNPSVSERLGIQYTPGSSDDGHVGRINSLKVNNTTTLSVLTFNSAKHSMWKFLDVKNFRALLNQLTAKYDYVIIDTSPLGITSEPAVVAQLVDAAIMVIKRDTIRTSRILSVLDTLNSTNVKILGCILNGVQSSHSRYGYGRYSYGYGYGYGYKYGYGYGYGEGYGSRKKKKQRSKKE